MTAVPQRLPKLCLLAALLAAAAGTLAGQQSSGGGAHPAGDAHEPEYGVAIVRDVMVPMRDGVRLATDLYLPARDGVALPGPWPTVVERTPYSKYRFYPNAPDGNDYARNGYVMVVQDVRGKFDSEGVFSSYPQEGPDGFDTVEWIREQPWSDGADHRHRVVLLRVDGAGHPGAEPAGPGRGGHSGRSGQLPRGRRLARRSLPAVAQRQLRAPAGGRRPGGRGESRGGGGAAGEPEDRELAAADAPVAAGQGLLAARAHAQLRRLVSGLAEPRAVRRVLAADGQRRHEALRERRRRAHPADRRVVRRVPGRHPGSARGVRRGPPVARAPRHQRRRARQRVLAAHLCRRRRPRTGFADPRRRGDDEVVRPARAGEGPRPSSPAT